MNEPEDIQLLRAIRQGDQAAFQTLYRRHRSGLYSFALLHCGAPDVAADVVQDVFMGLLNDSYGFDPLKGMLANFLYGVARNLVLGHARQNSRWVQSIGDDDEDDGWEAADPAAGQRVDLHGAASATEAPGTAGRNCPRKSRPCCD